MSLIPNPLDAVGAVSSLVTDVIDKIWPPAASPTENAAAKAAIMTAEFAPALEQIKINITEAANASVFVAGWRPFIGWVCGAAFAYKFLIQPFLVLLIVLVWPDFDIKKLPVLDWTELSTILLGMLGLSYHRTQEKLDSNKDK